ncbi:hypothetical protein [Mesorhizobium sp. M0011]|uniref:hypothetical protein n=1 Tax=Mesorhizobium sp. M0011 TaxID=2956839 RepID=UPI003334E663
MDDLIELQKDLAKQIAGYEAQKLAQVKSELEAFLKKKDAVVEAYKARYPDLLRRWKEEHEFIKDRLTKLKRLFSEAEIAAFFRKYVDPTESDVLAQRMRIEEFWRGRGKNELALRNATRDLEASKKTLDLLIANAQELDAVLKANIGLLNEIDEAVPKRNQGLAVYLLWAVLIPAHWRIAMFDDEALLQIKDDGPEALRRYLTPDDDTANQSGEEKGEAVATRVAAKPSPVWQYTAPAPRLILPSNFGKAIDDAWLDYKARKDAYGVAEGDFARDPDDLPTLAKLYNEALKTRDATIRAAIASGQVAP